MQVNQTLDVLLLSIRSCCKYLIFLYHINSLFEQLQAMWAVIVVNKLIEKKKHFALENRRKLANFEAGKNLRMNCMRIFICLQVIPA